MYNIISQSWERINHFLFISYGKNLFGIRPVWYKSKDLERTKDVYRGTTVFFLLTFHTKIFASGEILVLSHS
jgi:hypothetical protein